MLRRLMMASTPTGWTPAELSPVEWWDFADASTVTTASGAISQIASKGWGARVASNETAGNRPAVATVNSRSAAGFDGTNDFLEFTGLPTWPQMTVAHVFGRSSAGIKTQPLGGVDEASPPHATQWWTDNVRYSALGASGFNTFGTANTATGVFQSIVTKGATTTTMHQDGSAVGTPQTNITGAGTFYYLGRRGSDYHSGTMCETVIISSALSQADREKLEGYLAHKWGLAGALPGGHPYKVSPP